MWLSGLSAGLRTKQWQVRFPVRAHAWVAGQVPSRGHARDNHTLMFLSLFPFPSLGREGGREKKKEKKRKKEGKKTLMSWAQNVLILCKNSLGKVFHETQFITAAAL